MPLGEVRLDLMVPSIEALWLEVHLAYCKPIFVGYSPPSASVQYVEELCSVLMTVTETGK